MSFSFKPEVPQTEETQAPSQQPAAFGSSAPQNLMTRVSAEGKSMFQMILFVILGIAVLVAVGMFGYSYFLSSQIESKKATLASYESRLANLPLEDMRKLSNRIKLINQLVREHPSVNAAFRILEDSIEHEVTYNRFDLRYNETGKTYQLTLNGVATTYRTLAQQVDTYKRKPYTTYVSTISVESLQPNEKGNVDFTLKMPISIAGVLPESLNLSEGAAARVASSTDTIAEEVSTSTPVGTTTPQ